jgi:hypothetical protein
VRWRGRGRLHLEARAVDSRAGDHGVGPDDNGRRRSTHHRGAVEVAITVVP